MIGRKKITRMKGEEETRTHVLQGLHHVAPHHLLVIIQLCHYHQKPQSHQSPSQGNRPLSTARTQNLINLSNPLRPPRQSLWGLHAVSVPCLQVQLLSGGVSGGGGVSKSFPIQRQYSCHRDPRITHMISKASNNTLTLTTIQEYQRRETAVRSHHNAQRGLLIQLQESSPRAITQLDLLPSQHDHFHHRRLNHKSWTAIDRRSL